MQELIPLRPKYGDRERERDIVCVTVSESTFLSCLSYSFYDM